MQVSSITDGRYFILKEKANNEKILEEVGIFSQIGKENFYFQSRCNVPCVDSSGKLERGMYLAHHMVFNFLNSLPIGGKQDDPEDPNSGCLVRYLNNVHKIDFFEGFPFLSYRKDSFGDLIREKPDNAGTCDQDHRITLLLFGIFNLIRCNHVCNQCLSQIRLRSYRWGFPSFQQEKELDMGYYECNALLPSFLRGQVIPVEASVEREEIMKCKKNNTFCREKNCFNVADRGTFCKGHNEQNEDELDLKPSWMNLSMG